MREGDSGIGNHLREKDPRGGLGELRTARHVTAVAKYIELLGDVRPGKEIVVENIPTYEEMNEKGLGPWLAPAP